MSLIEQREKLKEDLQTKDDENLEDIVALKSLLVQKSTKPRSGLVFKNSRRTIITENNLANDSKACCIQ